MKENEINITGASCWKGTCKYKHYDIPSDKSQPKRYILKQTVLSSDYLPYMYEQLGTATLYTLENNSLMMKGQKFGPGLLESKLFFAEVYKCSAL